MNAEQILKELLSEYNLSDYIYDVKEREGLGWKGPKVVRFAELLSEASKSTISSPPIQDAIGREITVLTPFLYLRKLRFVTTEGVTESNVPLFSDASVVYPRRIDMDTRTGEYTIAGIAYNGSGENITIQGKSGKNPLIYKLANSVGEL